MIKMDTLKLWATTIGMNNPKTYIQSGNMIFSYSSNTTTIEWAQLLSEQIKSATQWDIYTQVWLAEEWDNIITNNPFVAEGVPANTLHATLCSIEPHAALVAELQQKSTIDRIAVVGKCLYLHCPNGYGNTVFTPKLLEKKLNLQSTTRNWNTVLALQQLFTTQ